jgi:hypothetical protein
MSERRVWIGQCLCPARHAIATLATEADDRREAEELLMAPLRAVVARLLREHINPWCGLCNAPADSWRYEVERSVFRTAAEAMPALQQSAAEQAATRAAFGDLHRNGKPN